MTYFVPYLLKDGQYNRIGSTMFTDVTDANLVGFIAHLDDGNACMPYVVLPFESDGHFTHPPETLPRTYARPMKELFALLKVKPQDDMRLASVTLTLEEVRTICKKYADRFDNGKPNSLDFRMESYGADNCDEEHRTNRGCDCWTGASEDDAGMILEEIEDDTSEYPAFALWGPVSKPLFDVTLKAIETVAYTATVRVRAANKEEAKSAALDKAENTSEVEFSSSTLGFPMTRNDDADIQVKAVDVAVVVQGKEEDED